MRPPRGDTVCPQGFRRVYEELGDISLDVPLAQGLLERLVELCCERGVITRALRDACPARYRPGELGVPGPPTAAPPSSSSAGAASAS